MMLHITNSVQETIQNRCDPLISCTTALYAHIEYEGVWYYLWKHETLFKDTWLISYGSEQKQDVFMVTESYLAASLAYAYAVEHGLMHVKGYLV